MTYFLQINSQEAIKYKCSETVFSVAENTANYLRNMNSKQGKLNFENE